MGVSVSQFSLCPLGSAVISSIESSVRYVIIHQLYTRGLDCQLTFTSDRQGGEHDPDQRAATYMRFRP
jgi:hypothetical protein